MCGWQSRIILSYPPTGIMCAMGRQTMTALFFLQAKEPAPAALSQTLSRFLSDLASGIGAGSGAPLGEQSKSRLKIKTAYRPRTCGPACFVGVFPPQHVMVFHGRGERLPQ